MDAKPIPEIPQAQAKEGSLTRRAKLTFVSSFLQQAARFVVGFGVTPIVIRGLGVELYGAWAMLRQSAGYIALSDLRPMGTLKFTLAVRQHSDDLEEKKRQIGAALIVWAFTLPLFITAGIGAIWAAPYFIRTLPQYAWPIRLAMGFMVLSVALDRLLSLPANVLRGMNLDYKAMGLNAVTILLGGLFTVLAIWGGWGLPGVAAASICGVLVASGVRFLVARQVLPWFGVVRPSRKELVEFAKLSAWLFFSSLGGILLLASDLIVVGWILGPAAAAVYATTGGALRLFMAPVQDLLSSGTPGISEICGREGWQRLEQIRTEMYLVALSCIAVIGGGILSLNQSFLHLWVGDGFYGGNLLNLLLVLIAFEMILYRIDAAIVNSMLQFRAIASITLTYGALSLCLGGVLAWAWGLPGMALGVFLGRLGLVFYLPPLIYRKGISMEKHLKSIWRPTIAVFILLFLSYLLCQVLRPATWLTLLITAIFIGSASFALFLTFGVNRDDRKMLKKRFSTFLPMLAGKT